MRILYVSHTLPPHGAILENEGGMQRVSRQLVDQWLGDPEVELSIEAINVSGRGFVVITAFLFLIKLLILLPRKVRETDADIILFSSMVTASTAFFLQNRIKIPMATINHGRDVTLKNPIYEKFLPRVFKALNGVISVSRATRQECIKRGMNPENGVALSNGLDSSLMDNVPDKQESRYKLKNELHISFREKKVLLTVGRQVKRKGHAWFIKNVFSQLPKNVLYLIIGDGPEGERLQKLVKQKRLQNRILLLGRQPDRILKFAYKAADIFIMPNIPVEGDMEGFGIVLLEANLAGTPAVASNLEGIKDVIADGKNGFTIPPYHPDEFVEATHKLLECNIEQFGMNACSFVRQKFGWPKVAEDYKTYLKQVVHQHKIGK